MCYYRPVRIADYGKGLSTFTASREGKLILKF